MLLVRWKISSDTSIIKTTASLADAMMQNCDKDQEALIRREKKPGSAAGGKGERQLLLHSVLAAV
jgi:hypothetical protein